MRKKKDVLFFGIHRPNRSPSQRYRIEQFLPVLDENGISYDYEYLLNEKRDELFYTQGSLIGKFYIAVYSVFKLIQIAFFRAKNYQTIFVQREMFMLGTSFFERQIALRSRLIFDFDDSIWMQNVSVANRKLAFLKNAKKTDDIIKAAHLNIAGNDFLADYARGINEHTVVIPTSIDTNEYKRNSSLFHKNKERVCIGWSGSQTTIEHFKLAEPMLLELKKKYGDKVYFKVLGDASYKQEELGISGVAWSRTTELKELEEFDIGIMPLPKDEWSKGKCALKALVYMSMELPAVVQNVGVNSQIIHDGINGRLANSKEEWLQSLSNLIENKAERIKLGKEGRKTIEDYYSISSNKELFLSCLRNV